MTFTASRWQGFGTTIFTEMSALAERTGAINLGQGFPDEDGPAEVLEAAARAIRKGHNQYAPLPGVPALRSAIAEHQRRFYGIELDPATQVQITMGATEAITAAVLGICEPGDGVLAFDPTYDSYKPAAMMAEATLTTVPLHPPEWRPFDPHGWSHGPARDNGTRWAAADVGPALRELLAEAPAPEPVYGA